MTSQDEAGLVLKLGMEFGATEEVQVLFEVMVCHG